MYMMTQNLNLGYDQGNSWKSWTLVLSRSEGHQKEIKCHLDFAWTEIVQAPDKSGKSWKMRGRRQ